MNQVEPSRSDARRNRARLIAVAAEELERDSTVSLSTIGKKAGVGQGTLYRHFPDRETLLWAVYEQEVDVLVELSRRLLETQPADEAFRAWMAHLADFALTKAHLGAAMNEAITAGAAHVRPGYARVSAVVEEMIAANLTAGSIRSDATTDDFLSLIAGLWQVAPNGDGRNRSRRMIDLVTDALHLGPAPSHMS